MYHYLYSNDMRISTLEEKATEYAHMFLTETVPSAVENKSVNNSANTVGYYLNLANKDRSARLAAKGDVRSVILNFIKTFQYPNARNLNNFKEVLNDGIQIAPLREIIKILFLGTQMLGPEFHLTKEEIINYIFYNDNKAKNTNPNRVDILKEVLQFRKTGVLESNIAPEEERIWKQEGRQVNELLSILIWSGFVRKDDEKFSLCINLGDSTGYKADLLDILIYDEYWEYPERVPKIDELRESYYEYVDSQIPKKKVESLQLENNIKINKLDKTIQNLYFGAPGTGKSYAVTELIKNCYPGVEEKENPFVFKTTVYQDYSYYNFVGSIMPSSKNDEITYEFKPGVFTQALAKALLFKDKDIFLVLEEMSRGNVASIFGDIFQLLDRDYSGESEYVINNNLISTFLKRKGIENDKIFLPSNLHILGTVNTSDQNVNVIDTAFKRRFGFIYVDVKPVYNADGYPLNSYEFSLGGDFVFEWNKLYMSLNKFITEVLELPEDKQIGQFFIKFENIIGNNADKYCYDEIQNKLLHYLWDDVQSASFISSEKIFKSKYKTFSNLYEGFKNRENVFSEKFL
ncbi:TPA: AAA family ATPase, partial [Staphylococcus delphini]|nr:AAA family ATPase [Staphylococcus delphini]